MTLGAAAEKEDRDAAGGEKKSSCWMVLIPILFFVLLRLPFLIHSPGIQDEQWFAVPGLTVWQEGIPRIPYVPTRERKTFFENADRCLMALPPGLFYLQAPFFAVLPASYATARVPLFLGAIFSIWLLFYVSRRLGASELVATIVATLYAFSRPLFFAGLVARPDMLCIAFGILTVVILIFATPVSGWKRYACAGAACGAAAICHPLALLFLMQSIPFLLCSKNLKVLLQRLVSFGVACGVILSLWLPLIVAYPHEFRSQFFSNVVDRAGPGLPSRLMNPLPSLKHHWTLVYEFAGPIQMAFLGVIIVVASILILLRMRSDDSGTPSSSRVCALLLVCWTSVFLTAVVVGLHPSKNYWLYPVFWIFAVLAVALSTMLGKDQSPKAFSFSRQNILAYATLIVGMLLMIPGAGLRTTKIYYENFGDSRYCGHRFIRQVLEQLPEDGVFLADLSYVFDVYLTGRETYLCQDRHLYWQGDDLDYSYILLAWEGRDAAWAEQYKGHFFKSFGSEEYPQSCFVNVFVPDETSPKSTLNDIHSELND